MDDNDNDNDNTNESRNLRIVRCIDAAFFSNRLPIRLGDVCVLQHQHHIRHLVVEVLGV